MPISKSFRQGCGISSILFNVYLEVLEKCLVMGTKIGDSPFCWWSIFAQDQYDIEYMLRKFEEYNRYNIKFNKTECMYFGGTLMFI